MSPCTVSLHGVLTRVVDMYMICIEVCTYCYVRILVYKDNQIYAQHDTVHNAYRMIITWA